MSKKLIISLATIGVVAAAAIGGTIAYFSDTETSQGNTFVAGSLDLVLNNVVLTEKTPVDEPLFTLPDVKPGDMDEKTLELKINNNPACGFAFIDLTSDLENNCNSPELKNETDCAVPGDGGELNDQINFMIWEDANCDNVYEPPNGLPGENLIANGPLTANISYALGELDQTGKCYGLAYCFGDWVGHQYQCDGSQLGNETQSDSFTADLTITALQKRNQFETCPKGVMNPLDGVDIGDVTSEEGHNLTDWSNAWVKPGWGGNYGGGSSDGSFRLLMGQGDGCVVPDDSWASFTMNAGTGYATQLTLEQHLDGSQNDSFDVYVDDVKIGHFAHIASGSELWRTTTFTLPAAKTGEFTVKLVATEPATSWCAQWGQVAFSSAYIK